MVRPCLVLLTGCWPVQLWTSTNSLRHQLSNNSDSPPLLGILKISCDGNSLPRFVWRNRLMLSVAIGSTSPSIAECVCRADTSHPMVLRNGFGGVCNYRSNSSWCFIHRDIMKAHRRETLSDPGMCLVMVDIEEGFPDTRRETKRHSCGILDAPREHVCVSDGASETKLQLVPT